jgi:ABC-type transport system involved in cytochrome c biogenesis permease subunit
MPLAAERSVPLSRKRRWSLPTVDHGIKLFCFTASYVAALGLELLHQFWPRKAVRAFSLLFGFAGLVAQTLFLMRPYPTISREYGLMLFLAWILAIFYLIGSLHHHRLAWGVFVLPLILGFIGVGRLFDPGENAPQFDLEKLPSMEGAWGKIHVGLLILAAVGVSVAFLASLMYLFQARRLRNKTLPTAGFRLLSLERLEAMNRRAVTFAFPLLTLGMVIGGVLMFQGEHPPVSWSDLRILSALLAWAAVAVMLYLHFGHHLAGRQVALLTVVTFAFFVVCLLLPHDFPQGGPP